MKESINLLPQIPSDKPRTLNFPERLIPMAVATTLVAEVLFFSILLLRAKFDRDLFFLKSNIEQRKPFVTVTLDIEEKIKNIQDKLMIIKELRGSKQSFLKAINFIPTLIPEDVTLLNLNLNKDGVELSARTTSGPSFAKLVENINRSADFIDLTLTGSTFEDASGYYTFTLESRVKKELFD